jgi:hypothetical protein
MLGLYSFAAIICALGALLNSFMYRKQKGKLQLFFILLLSGFFLYHFYNIMLELQ